MKKKIIVPKDFGYIHITLNPDKDHLMGVLYESDKRKKKKVTSRLLAHAYRGANYYYVLSYHNQFHLWRNEQTLTMLLDDDVELTEFGRQVLLAIPSGDVF